MYTKLAIQNMKKSIRNYVIYFVTITLTAAMMYSFLALGFSKDVLSMSENMSMLTSGILGMSVLVALIASFVISYAIRFMLEQRKKEFATYELLGMETSNIQKLFFIENGVIGTVSYTHLDVYKRQDQLIHNVLTYESPLFLYSIMKRG